MSERKMFVFDLDGTLLNSDSKISKKNIEALEMAKKKNHLLVIATGRNYIYSQMCIKQNWGLFDYYVGCNGALIHSIIDREVKTENKYIPFKFVTKLIKEIKKIGGTIQVSTEWDVFTDYHIDENIELLPKFIKERYFDPFPSIDKVTAADKESIIQISIHFEPHNIRKMWEKWTKEFGDKYEIAITSPRNIDINLKNVDKLSAIKKIIKEENVDFHNVFVFGDSQNDIKGLEYFNNTYAMDNAIEGVKQSAKHVIGDNDSNDIAKIILKNI